MATVLGLDIGSRSVDAVWVKDGSVEKTLVLDSGFDAQEVCESLIDRGHHDIVVATGYGRHAAAENFGAEVITEIKAFALGALHIFPRTAAVLDIGGQDTKVIVLGQSGKVSDFIMNDKCAAGTGKFLEVMAKALGYRVEEMGPASLTATTSVKISPMCTVFAESEVTGLLHKGEDRAAIAFGLHDSIVSRTLGMLKRSGAGSPLLFAGGVARNPAILKLIKAGFSGEVFVPDDPQTLGALGAAIYGKNQADG